MEVLIDRRYMIIPRLIRVTNEKKQTEEQTKKQKAFPL